MEYSQKKVPFPRGKKIERITVKTEQAEKIGKKKDRSYEWPFIFFKLTITNAYAFRSEARLYFSWMNIKNRTEKGYRFLR